MPKSSSGRGGKRSNKNALVSTKSTATGRWTADEKLLFLHGLKKCGRGKWRKIGQILPSRTHVQIKSHAQKVLKRQETGEDIFAPLTLNRDRVDELLREQRSIGVGFDSDLELLASGPSTTTPPNTTSHPLSLPPSVSASATAHSILLSQNEENNAAIHEASVNSLPPRAVAAASQIKPEPAIPASPPSPTNQSSTNAASNLHWNISPLQNTKRTRKLLSASDTAAINSISPSDNANSTSSASAGTAARPHAPAFRVPIYSASAIPPSSLHCVYCHQTFSDSDSSAVVCRIPHDIRSWQLVDNDGTTFYWHTTCFRCGQTIRTTTTHQHQTIVTGYCYEGPHSANMEERLSRGWDCDLPGAFRERCGVCIELHGEEMRRQRRNDDDAILEAAAQVFQDDEEPSVFQQPSALPEQQASNKKIKTSPDTVMGV